jgi:hypothetical protein
MLVVELPALVDICLTEMCLLCHLHQKMSMKLRCSLLLKEEPLLYQLLWVPKGSHFPVGSLMLFIVHAVGYHGTSKVIFG